MKFASDIVKWGFVKPYFDKEYQFNSIDIETIDNEMFIFGYMLFGKYHYVEDDFYETFHQLLIESIRFKYDILTWTRYDNTHILKMLLRKVPKKQVNKILLRIGKVSPIYTYTYQNFTVTIENIIKDNMIFSVNDGKHKARRCIIYNLKNLFNDDLLKVAKSYKVNYYSKMGEEYHVIDKKRYSSDVEFKKNVLLSNELDNRVIIDIANKMLENFKTITGVYPKSIYTAGSLARSYLLSYDKLKVIDLQFKTIFKDNEYFDKLLDYSMRSYHGGKIESYVLGYIKKAKIIDITSAYPYAFSKLPKITNNVWYFESDEYLDLFFYAFIHCDIEIDDPNLIHPVVVANPINNTNISAIGYLDDVVITKIEYDYLIQNGCKVVIHDYIGVEHEEVYPYKELVDLLFQSRMENKENNPSIADLFKTIINSLYGITFELTDVYEEINGKIVWKGYRAGDYFNPILASYITGTIRTYLSDVSYHIVKNGGEVYLNMTDSIIYDGEITLDIFSDKKVLGKFENPSEIKDILILGTGRYEYKDVFKDKYTIKNRGFSVNIKDKSFYSTMNLRKGITIKNNTFVTMFKATTNKYSFEQLGHIIEDDYDINPFNVGGKRIVENLNVNLNKEYTKTHAVKLEKGVLN